MPAMAYGQPSDYRAPQPRHYDRQVPARAATAQGYVGEHQDNWAYGYDQYNQNPYVGEYDHHHRNAESNGYYQNNLENAYDDRVQNQQSYGQPRRPQQKPRVYGNPESLGNQHTNAPGNQNDRPAAQSGFGQRGPSKPRPQQRSHDIYDEQRPPTRSGPRNPQGPAYTNGGGGPGDHGPFGYGDYPPRPGTAPESSSNGYGGREYDEYGYTRAPTQTHQRPPERREFSDSARNPYLNQQDPRTHNHVPSEEEMPNFGGTSGPSVSPKGADLHADYSRGPFQQGLIAPENNKNAHYSTYTEEHISYYVHDHPASENQSQDQWPGGSHEGLGPHEGIYEMPTDDSISRQNRDPRNRGPDGYPRGGHMPPGAYKGRPPPGRGPMPRNMTADSYHSDPGLHGGYHPRAPNGRPDPSGRPSQDRPRLPPGDRRPRGPPPPGMDLRGPRGPPPPGMGPRGFPPPGMDPRRGPDGRKRPPPGYIPRDARDPRDVRRPPRDPHDPRARELDPREPPRGGPPGPGNGPSSDRRERDRYGRSKTPDLDRSPHGTGRGAPGAKSADEMPPRPSTAPGRHPGEKIRTNQPSSRPPNLQDDKLPHHPTPAGPWQKPLPIRPGLQQNGPGQPGPQPNQQSAHPAPIRQYDTDAAKRAANESETKNRKSQPITQEDLSRVRAAALSRPRDPRAQLRLAKSLIEASKVLANEGGQANAQTGNTNRERYLSEAQGVAKRLLDLRDPDGMFFYADCLGSGALGLRNDAKEAFGLYQSAAKGNHPIAAYRTAVCCELGVEEGGGTRRDIGKAMQWYQRAGTLGDPAALFKLGIIYIKGLLEQPKNMQEGIQWLQKGAEVANEENPHALHELALLYESGDHADILPKDETRALELFTQAGKLGYKHSQFHLGQAWEYGLLGCPIEARNSIIWYTRAAAQGEHQSELALSGWYLTGSEGILEASDTEAYLWARKAAASTPPLPKALFALGYFTETGIGTQRHVGDAKFWYEKAYSYNFPKAKDRLDELRRTGGRVTRPRENLSRTNPKQHEADCIVM